MDELEQKIHLVTSDCLEAAKATHSAEGQKLGRALVEVMGCVEMIFERLVRGGEDKWITGSS